MNGGAICAVVSGVEVVNRPGRCGVARGIYGDVGTSLRIVGRNKETDGELSVGRLIKVAARRVVYRSAHLRWRHPCTYQCRARRQLYPRAARHASRSNHGAPLRIASSLENRGRKRVHSLEQWLDRLRPADENNEYGHEGKPLESASRCDCYGQGNRFRRFALSTDSIGRPRPDYFRTVSQKVESVPKGPPHSGVCWY
jgi:hypothetical protein